MLVFINTMCYKSREWEDWQEKDSTIIYCLFCTKPFPNRDAVMSHMTVSGSHDQLASSSYHAFMKCLPHNI